ncbi:MAG: hybrid sensor histidine kinase/response regulator [Acidobacteria bacterium]|nr:hybrid sensor histidine kinase/response regulator [Acidobacteriota bacterium]
MGKRLLIVDDEPLILHGLTRTLQTQFEVVSAQSGPEGLDRFSQEGPFPVVISEMRMPGMSGTDFLGHVRKLAPDTVRILLSGNLDLEAMLSAVNEGTVFRVLVKPAAPELLTSILQDAFDHYRLAMQDRVLLQSKLEEVRNQTYHLERLATMGTLAAGVGHELNNLAQVFQSTLQLIKGDVEADQPPRADHLRRLERVGDHLAHHATALLRLARKPSEGPIEVDLALVVAETLEMLKETGMFKRINLNVCLPQTPVRIRVPRRELEQVLLNLLRNASDAFYGIPDCAAHILVSVEPDWKTRRMRLTVKDSGCGIPPDQLEVIFQPYFTTKPPDRGTGLGLPVVKQIVEENHGCIRVESQAGHGSTFCIEWPLLEA